MNVETLKSKIYRIIFEADTPAGKTFDLVLLWAILLSIAAVSLESVSQIQKIAGSFFYLIEWTFTIFFTIEYALRIFCMPRPWRYITSFYGIVDLLAIIPTYLSLYFSGVQTLLVIRCFRLLRVFRILKLARYIGEARVLNSALSESFPKVIVFLGAVMTIVLVMGSLMYLIEGHENGFTSIPRSMYWAVVTLTTVGYGDMTPKTVLGQAVAGFVMIMGYCIIAVPTGIVTAEMTRNRRSWSRKKCRGCLAEDHEPDARYCKHCGDALPP